MTLQFLINFDNIITSYYVTAWLCLDLINVGFLTGCYNLYQVSMTLQFLNSFDDIESTLRLIITSELPV